MSPLASSLLASSPLASSLLALAALLASTSAQGLLPRDGCDYKHIGTGSYSITYHDQKQEIDTPGGILQLRNECLLGTKLVSEDVVACNRLPDAETPTLILDPNDLLTIKIFCGTCYAGIDVIVRQYCDRA